MQKKKKQKGEVSGIYHFHQSDLYPNPSKVYIYWSLYKGPTTNHKNQNQHSSFLWVSPETPGLSLFAARSGTHPKAYKTTGKWAPQTQHNPRKVNPWPPRFHSGFHFHWSPCKCFDLTKMRRPSHHTQASYLIRLYYFNATHILPHSSHSSVSWR